MTYKPFGERTILVEWPPEIKPHILQDILCFKEKIANKKIKYIIDIRTAYNSLLVIYKKIDIDFEYEVNKLKEVYKSNDYSLKIESRLWKIPVCYDAIFGVDLDVISETNNISKEDIIKRHSKAIYTVYFIGFLPGFLYLGGLDETLFTPRKGTPRLKIEKGAVAIGGNQTGIYPDESPGGWNIIGNSPINFFDTSKDQPCFAKAGDKLQFYSITLNEHENIKALLEVNEFQLESEGIDG
ncbi:5-oxoprolinase subunit PxpB [uncultured Algibacter sp.]|uniref:5-oxoprolinase subunit PxpB n=1 Tax=uncultured Algibacter sp. TaxID=298659 RepID=UPI00262B0193|nr:5-oxoprolinase subunit PxpB [uncultured Algibacter sp.]